MRIVLVIAAVAALGIGLWWAFGPDGAEERGGGAAVAGPSEPAAPTADPTAGGPTELAAGGTAPGDAGPAVRSESRTAAEAAAAPEAVAAPEEADVASRVVGRVVDGDGAPVADAQVELALPFFRPAAFGGDRAPVARAAETGPDGRFEIETKLRGGLRLKALASGYAPASRRDVRPPEEGTLDVGDVVVAQGALLSGRVVDADGRPVEGAMLHVESTDPGYRSVFEAGDPVAESGPDGTFLVEHLACGPWRIAVAHPAHPVARFEGTADVPGRETSGLRFALPRGGAIRGVAVGVPEGKRGAMKVLARPAGEFGLLSRRDAELADDGTFVVEGLALDTIHELRLREEASGGSFRSVFGSPSRSERVRARTGDAGVRLEYRLGASVAFTAVDRATGRPVEALTGSLDGGFVYEPLRPAEGADGYPGGVGLFEEIGVREDASDYVLQVASPGYRDLELDLVLSPGQALDLGTVFLDPAPLLTVRVVDDATGEPVEGARVRYGPEPEPQVGANGFRNVERRISVRAGGGGDDEVEIDDGSGTRSARTDADGIARFTALVGERARIEATSDAHATERRDGVLSPAEASTEELRLGPGGAVVVTVLDAAGEPLANQRVTHRELDQPFDPFQSFGFGGGGETTDAEGRVAFGHLAPGRHGFRLDAPQSFSGGAFLVLEDDARPDEEGFTVVDVAHGSTDAVELVAEPRGAIVGRVREAGAALAGASVSLRRPRSDDDGPAGFRMIGPSGPRARTDGDGGFRIEDVTLGEFELVVEHPSRAMEHVEPLDVRAGEQRHDVELPLSIVRGRVLDPEGRPVAGAVVRVEPAVDESQPQARAIMMFATNDGDGEVVQIGGADVGPEARTGPDGRYQLRGVRPDVPLQVVAKAELAAEARSEEFEVAVDAVRDGVDVTATPAGGLLVKLQRADGTAPGFCMVTATPEAGAEGGEPDPGETEREISQGTGEASFDGLRPGNWTVEAFEMGFAGGDPETVSQSVEIVRGERGEILLTLP